MTLVTLATKLDLQIYMQKPIKQLDQKSCRIDRAMKQRSTFLPQSEVKRDRFGFHELDSQAHYNKSFMRKMIT